MDYPKEVEAKIGQALQECLREIPYKVKSQISQIVAKSLGFRDRSGEWEIDHTNGRTSTVGILVTNAVAKKVEQAVIKASEKFKVSDKMIEAIKKDMMDSYHRLLWDAVKRKMESIIAADAEKLIKELIPDFSAISTELKAMLSPTYGSKEIEKVAIAARVVMDEEEE